LITIVGRVIVMPGRVIAMPRNVFHRDTLKVPDGLAFSEFRGYDTWQTIAVSETEGSVKAILGNPTMISAYKEGVPDNSKLFPEGSKTVESSGSKRRIQCRRILSKCRTP
jgi:hypothetical protein